MQRRLVQFDWAMKNLLRNKANFAILEGFLSELLSMPIKINTILESESNKNHANDKSNKADLLCITDIDEKILIELQVDREWDYLQHMLYGASKLVTEYIEESDAYGKIGKVIAVNIVFFDLGHGEDYIYHGTTTFKGLRLGDNLQLSKTEKGSLATFRKLPTNKADNLEPKDVYPEYYVIKIKKFKNKIISKFDEWVYFLKNSDIPTTFDAKGLSLAKKKLDILSLSDPERKDYEGYVRSLHDKASEVETHNLDLKFAREEGEAKGRAEEKLEMAKAMLLQGLSLDIATKISELSPEVLAKLTK
jgi:predicted transposase/invertase (TIGR01784 family)